MYKIDSSNTWTVYRHINTINHKSYIGITSRPVQDRWKNGLGYCRQLKFYNAIKKYGWANFEHIILEENLSEQEAKIKEQEYIKLYDAKENGYNLTDGGEGTSGFHHTQNTKEQISRTQQNNANYENGLRSIQSWHQEHPEARSEWMKERWANDTSKRKILCVETGEVFNTVREAAEFAGLKNSSGISACLAKRQHTAGKHPITKQKLSWKYAAS